MFIGPETYCFTAGRGVGSTDRLLEVLACVSACHDKPFRALHRAVIERHDALSSCVCVLLAWDEPRQELVRNLEALGTPTRVFVVGERGALDGLPSRPPAGGRPDRRRTGAPVSPPPLLLGAALIFWGWQTGFLLVAIPLAVLIEAAGALRWRLDLSSTDFHRVTDLCTLLIFVTGVYLFSTTGTRADRGRPAGHDAAVPVAPAAALP